MSTPAPSPASKARPGQVAPPDDEFWEKYSPHYEFPLSSVGAIAAHVVAALIFSGSLWLLSGIDISDTNPVPMIGITVDGDGSGENGAGGGGGEPMPKEDINPLERPMDPSRPIPEADLAKIKELDQWIPKVPSTDDGLRPQDLDTIQKINKLNDDLRKALLDGMSRKKGKGPGDGAGNSGVEGKGSNATGDPSSSGNRAVRWELNFRTNDARDYLNQLAAMKATLVIPQPTDWKTNKAYRNLLSNPSGEIFEMKDMPGLYFVDDSSDSAGRIGEVLKLSFSPPFFIAFFPKEIEEKLAKEERAYRGRKESEIFSTKFKILIRNGEPAITVVDQIPVKR